MANKVSPIPPGGRSMAPSRGGRGRQPGGFGLGPGGSCSCPKCGREFPHQRGMPCYAIKCPDCGVPLTRAQ